MTSFNIGADLDGVGHLFDGSFRKWVVDTGTRTVEQCDHPISGMDFYLDWKDDDGVGISHELFSELCHAGVDAGVVFGYGEPLDGYRQALIDLMEANHRVHIVTFRLFGKLGASERVTKQWLKRYDIPYDTLTFSQDKTVVDTDFFIEDNKENYDLLDKTLCIPYLINRSWNQEDDLRRRVDTMSEFVGHVLDHSRSYV